MSMSCSFSLVLVLSIEINPFENMLVTDELLSTKFWITTQLDCFANNYYELYSSCFDHFARSISVIYVTVGKQVSNTTKHVFVLINTILILLFSATC